MEPFSIKAELRWADLDPNFHVLHSKYYDLGASCRMAFLVQHGLTPAVMKQLNTGPVIFREECIFKREMNFGDDILINLRISKLSPDCSRWSMEHEIWRNGDTLAALMSVDGAWIDTVNRKLAAAPAIIKDIFATAPKTENFEITNR